MKGGEEDGRSQKTEYWKGGNFTMGNTQGTYI